MRVLLPDRSDEARLFAQIDATSTTSPSFEVQRILKAFVDAQWLTELDARLAGYREALERDIAEATDRARRSGSDAG